MDAIQITKASSLKPKPKAEDLVFGATFTDHMFLLDYEKDMGWHSPRIVPYGPLSLMPAAKSLHYSQEVFEGMKAYRSPQDDILLFRPKDNLKRLNASCERMCMPKIDEDFVLKALKKLVLLEQDWIPRDPGASLYIRPFIIANDNALGIHTSHHYLLAIILCPVGAYYSSGINPVKIFVEPSDVRAVKGGTGMAKTGGNYAASLRAGELAEKKGFHQVLWLDAVHRKFVEEVGSMNVMFKVGDRILTPDLNGSVLDGITRRSCIALLKSWGYVVEERRIDIEDLFDAAKAGVLEEAWGCGTAAVISPIGSLTWQDTAVDINRGVIGELTQKLYDTLTDLQWGRIPDQFDWSMKL